MYAGEATGFSLLNKYLTLSGSYQILAGTIIENVKDGLCYNTIALWILADVLILSVTFLILFHCLKHYPLKSTC